MLYSVKPDAVWLQSSCKEISALLPWWSGEHRYILFRQTQAYIFTNIQHTLKYDLNLDLHSCSQCGLTETKYFSDCFLKKEKPVAMTSGPFLRRAWVVTCPHCSLWSAPSHPPTWPSVPCWAQRRWKDSGNVSCTWHCASPSAAGT